MTAIFSFRFFAPGPMELLIIGLIVILLFGLRLPRLVYWVGQEIAAIQQQLDRPDNTRYRRIVFFCLLVVIAWLALMMLLNR